MKKALKKEKLNIRINSEEKKKIARYAKRVNMSMSDYVRMKLFMPDKKRNDSSILMGIVLVRIQEIGNYVQEKYEESDELMGMVDELWEIIQG